jgi:flagellar protein FliS
MWRDAYLENRVLSADPLELVYMLYERALTLVSNARASLKAGDIAERSKAISRTVEILAELEGALDHEAGGEISRNLQRLYQHMRTRLITANVKQQDAPLAEVESLLQTLGEAWKSIRPQAVADDPGNSSGATADRWTGTSGGGSGPSGNGWKV